MNNRYTKINRIHENKPNSEYTKINRNFDAQAGPPPVFEPGLEDLVNSLRGKNLVFTSSLEQTVTESQVQGAGCRV